MSIDSLKYASGNVLLCRIVNICIGTYLVHHRNFVNFEGSLFSGIYISSNKSETLILIY